MKAWLKRVLVVLLLIAAPVAISVAPESSPHPTRWDPRVVDLVHFVEQERGLRCEHPVGVEFLSDKDFRAKVTPSKEERAKEQKDQERFLGELRALGLVSGNPDLGAAQDTLVGSSVVGLYVNEEKTLYVRGQQLTEYVKSVLVHELTHALQDQHFDLKKLEDKAPYGAEIATTALIEGDAVRVQQAWVATLSSADRADYARGEEAAGKTASEAKDVPQVLQDMLTFPYVIGPAYVDSLVVQGSSGVDKAFREPPVSEAQVFDPVDYGVGFRPEAVADPAVPAGGTRSAKPGAFGQFSLFEVLGSQLGEARAWQAVSGWAGDRYISYRKGGKACLAIDVESRDEAHAQVLQGALQAWRRGLPAVTLERSGRTVSVTTCDPGKDLVRTQAQPSAFEVVAARAQAISLVVDHAGVDYRRATCLVQRVLDDLGPVLFVKNDPTPDEQLQATRAFQRASESC